MSKLLKRVILFLLVISAVYILLVVRDRQTLRDRIIRLHVVGASNTEEDQRIKELVRDAVVEELNVLTSCAVSKEDAQKILSENLMNIQNTANEVLAKAEVSDKVRVTLKQEAFPSRVYDTFSLPAGVYDSLRIEIGEAEGRNWWCVVFPSLCIPAASDGVEDVAASAGFSDGLGKTLTGEKGYEVRFFLLDTLGWLENLFFDN